MSSRGPNDLLDNQDFPAHNPRLLVAFALFVRQIPGRASRR
jgi:hypothetical protein